jgi:hypothetical protein
MDKAAFRPGWSFCALWSVGASAWALIFKINKKFREELIA